jgi:NAD(P)-dependent dehydrogenase (short-subunit alcohol dehydrogenase family)
MQLHQARALISGGASGLGLAVATRIVRAGGIVAILDTSVAKGVSAAQSLGEHALFVATDVTDESAVDDAVRRSLGFLGEINAAVNCAGTFKATRLVGKAGPMTGEAFREVVEINLVGTVLMVKAATSAMQLNAPNAQGQRGVIIMTASIAAFDGSIGQVAYAASKGAIVAMTLPMARELASSGIRVMTIAPGPFATPMVQQWPLEAQNALGKQIPFPSRLGNPDEFAALVEHILVNPMLNGETIRIDGAIRLQAR